MAASAARVSHSGMPRTRSALFDRWSVVYDRPGVQGATYRPVHNAVIARLTDVQPSVVVDLGCGTGQLTQRLAERFPDARVIGIDYSAGMLGEAAGRVGVTASLMQADAHRLPIRACSVDVVVCTESFHWYRDQAHVMAGLAAVVRPGGQLLIASIASITGAGDNVVRQMSSAAGQPIRALPPRRLRQLLADSGFRVTYQRRIPRLGLIPWPVLTQAMLG